MALTNAERQAKWRRNQLKPKPITEHLAMPPTKAQIRKIRVLTVYGNGKLACVRCGFDDVRALSIDHINGGGSEDRRQKGLKSSGFYGWLQKHNYPDGFQTLCMNCQWVKRFENSETSYLDRQTFLVAKENDKLDKNHYPDIRNGIRRLQSRDVKEWFETVGSLDTILFMRLLGLDEREKDVLRNAIHRLSKQGLIVKGRAHKYYLSRA